MQVFEFYAADTSLEQEAVASIGEDFWKERRMHHHIYHFNEVRVRVRVRVTVWPRVRVRGYTEERCTSSFNGLGLGSESGVGSGLGSQLR